MKNITATFNTVSTFAVNSFLVAIGAGIVARRFWERHNMTDKMIASLIVLVMAGMAIAQFVSEDVIPFIKAHWANAPVYAAIVYVGSKAAAKFISHAAQCTAGLTEAIALVVADSAAVMVAKCMIKAHINAQMGRKVFAHA